MKSIVCILAVMALGYYVSASSVLDISQQDSYQKDLSSLSIGEETSMISSYIQPLQVVFIEIKNYFSDL